MKRADLRVVKVAETRFVLEGSEGAPWEIWQTDTENDAQKLVEFAGRLCYSSWSKPNPATRANVDYINHIIESQHFSVLEHAGFAVAVTGVSRSLSHELVRHRHLSFCLAGDSLIFSDIYDYTRAKQDGTPRRRGPTKHRLDQLFEYTKTPQGRLTLRNIRVRSLDESTGTFTQGLIRRVVCSGIKPVFRVELEDGKMITSSKEHRFLTPHGWLCLNEIVGGLDTSPGGLAVYRSLAVPIMANGIPAHRDREWLQTHYHEKGLGLTTIASLAGVSKHTLRTWIRKYGLQKPLGSWTKGRKPWNKGRRYHAGWNHTSETRRLLAELKRGERNPQWKGGVTQRAIQLRRPILRARREIFERDHYTCPLCHRRGGRLTLHHVIPVWARADLAQDRDNVVTLCRACHFLIAGRELQYIERLGRSLSEIPAAARPRHPGYLVLPRPQRIRSITYMGEQMTYDIEMEDPYHNFVANGIVTHNSQLSQRFFDETDAAAVIPSLYRDNPDALAVLDEVYQLTMDAYKRLVEIGTRKLATMKDKSHRRKRVREAARAVLPNMTEVHIVVSGNHRAWREFFEKRGDPHAEPEIREVAVKIFKEVAQPLAPAVYQDLSVEQITLDTGEVWEAIRRRHPQPAHTGG